MGEGVLIRGSVVASIVVSKVDLLRLAGSRIIFAALDGVSASLMLVLPEAYYVSCEEHFEHHRAAG